MKTTKYLAIVALALTFLIGCKKNDTQTPDPTISINADGSLNISNADGALYAIESKNFDTYNGATFDETQYAYAWFGKFPAVSNAGVVKVNNIEVDNFSNIYTSFAFLSTYDTLFKGANLTAAWSVAGNTTSGISAFTHTDNTALPTAPAFTLPASVNINNSLTVNHTATGGALGVLYTLSGSNGDTTKFVANTSSTVTFSSSEIKAVALAHDRVGLSVMPVTYSSATYGGKQYYFIKQHQYTRETVTQ